MRVAVYPSDPGAVGSYRVRWPAEELARRGYDVTIDTPPIRRKMVKPDHLPEHAPGMHPRPWQRVVDADVDADVVVLQRLAHRSWVETIPLLRAKGVRVVVELDDNYDLLHRENVAWRAFEPHWLPDFERVDWEQAGPVKVAKRVPGWSYCPDVPGDEHRLWLREVVALADHVVVSTPALGAHYGRWNPSFTVVPNCVPAAYVELGERRGADDGRVLRVGWAGSVNVHPNDVHQIGDALTKVRRPHRLVVIGDGVGVPEAVGRPLDLATGWVPLDDFPVAYSLLDVALCPLERSRFNNSKSGLKMLQAAALGVIPIGSPSPEYLRLNERGVGLIAHTPREWRDHIEMLLGSPLERHRLRTRGLEVARTLTIEGQAESWLSAWSGVPAELVQT